jgi:ElaB/YqjD/DUF883 family membrane-anchored ribosome-binding protein
MDQKLTDDTLTREQAMEVAQRVGEHPLEDSLARRAEAARPRQTVEKVKSMVRDIGDQAREQASTAGDALYRQGQRTGEYLTQNVNEYPLAALLIAGIIGYGLAYLIHTRWQN